MIVSEYTNKKRYRSVILVIALITFVLFLFLLSNRKRLKLPKEGTWTCEELDLIVCMEDHLNGCSPQEYEAMAWHSFAKVEGEIVRVVALQFVDGFFRIDVPIEKYGKMQTAAESICILSGDVIEQTQDSFTAKDRQTGEKYTFHKVDYQIGAESPIDP